MSQTPIVFRRFGGSLQLRIRTFTDLERLGDLDPALWIATACPTTGMNCDPRFLAHLDSDGNNRVRTEELLKAIAWTGQMLADRSGCDEASEVLILDRLTPAAAPLRAAAEQVLANLHVADRTRITLAQIRSKEEILKQESANGDGVVPPDAVEDATLKQAVADLLTVMPGVKDQGGHQGVDQATLDAFGKARDAALAWHDAPVLPWGPGSIEQARLVERLRPALDAYFLQCRLVAVQPDAGARLRLTAERLDESLADPAALKRWLDALPVAEPDPAGRLTWSALRRGPSFEPLIALRDTVATPALGAAPALDEAGWTRLRDQAAACLAWKADEAKHPVLKLGADRLRGLDGALLSRLGALCADDKRISDSLARVVELERLVLFQRWLVTFANNFVAMPDLYDSERRALFEQGTLVMAGRVFSLAVLVADRASHTAMIGESNTYILYVQCSGGSPARSFEVAVPVTSGTSTGLFVGKRGIFFGADGQQYDAVVLHIVTKPISLREAVVMPFIRIGRFVERKIEEWAARSDKEFEGKLEAKHQSVIAPKPATSPPPPPPPAAAAKPGAPAAPGAPGNMVMGIGIAFAAVGSSVAFLMSAIKDMDVFDWVITIFSIAAIVAVPATVLAWVKLRRRNLAVLLEASGWALNDRLKLTRHLGAMLTWRPRRPAGSRIDLTDQVGALWQVAQKRMQLERKRRWPWVVTLLVVLAAAAGGGWWWWSHRAVKPTPAPASATAPTTAPTPVATPER